MRSACSTATYPRHLALRRLNARYCLPYYKDNSQQSKKLNEMNLDDTLKLTEEHEPAAVQNNGASLRREGFLKRLANVSDVKSDMNWEDVMPTGER